jgi:hypothetical protein
MQKQNAATRKKLRVRRNRESWLTMQRLNPRDSSVGLRKKIYTGPIVTFSHGWLSGETVHVQQ